MLIGFQKIDNTWGISGDQWFCQFAESDESKICFGSNPDTTEHRKYQGILILGKP